MMSCACLDRGGGSRFLVFPSKLIQFSISKIQYFSSLHYFAVNNKHSWHWTLWKTIGKTSWKEFSNALGRSVPWFDFTHRGYHFSSHSAVCLCLSSTCSTWLDQDPAASKSVQLCAGLWGCARGISLKFHWEIGFLSKRASELFVFHWSGVIRWSEGIGPSDHDQCSFDSFWLWQATCCPTANAPFSCCCGQRCELRRVAETWPCYVFDCCQSIASLVSMQILRRKKKKQQIWMILSCLLL